LSILVNASLDVVSMETCPSSCWQKIISCQLQLWPLCFYHCCAKWVPSHQQLSLVGIVQQSHCCEMLGFSEGHHRLENPPSACQGLTYMLKSLPSGPHNVIVFRNKVIKLQVNTNPMTASFWEYEVLIYTCTQKKTM
jgi:hypothetical protein